MEQVSIGLANLPNQIHRDQVLKGFDFNIMIAGDVGLGKSTFINMLFESDIYVDQSYDEYNSMNKDIDLKCCLTEMVENGTKMRLEVVDIDGFGLSLNMNNSWNKISSFLKNRLDDYLKNETQLSRNTTIRDSRIHCCFYFIPPSCHRLRPIDIEFMKLVDKLVNLIPIIGKADSMTLEELEQFKKRISQDIIKHDIHIYDLKNRDIVVNNSNLENINYTFEPFSIISSTELIEIDGKSVHARKYHWGTVNIDNNPNSDFLNFKDLFLKTFLYDMAKTTNSNIYECYRRKIIGGDQLSIEISSDDIEQQNNMIEAAKEQLEHKKQEFSDAYNNILNSRKTKLTKMENEFALKLEERKLELDKITLNSKTDEIKPRESFSCKKKEDKKKEDKKKDKKKK